MPIEFVCKNCSKVFHVPPSKVKQSHVQYCSSACYHHARKIDAQVRFWNFVDKSRDCWLWTGTCTPSGYGSFSDVTGIKVMAHRYSWTLHNGPIPAGMCVCHHCDTPACVRPDHLFLGTKKANSQDMAHKGRGIAQVHPEIRQGERNGRHKLTAEQVREIRARYGTNAISAQQLADEYGVSNGAIWFIVNNLTWTHVLDII